MDLEIKLCDYGCGEEAKFLFKNGKWCCSKKWNQCSVSRKKISFCSKGRIVTKETRIKKSKSSKGRIVTEETRKKLSKSGKGKVHTEKTKRKISKGNKGKIRSKQTRQKISKFNKGKILPLETRKKISKSNKGRIVTEETRKKLSTVSKFSIQQIEEKYPTFAKVEEMRYNPNNLNEIQVHCKNHNCPNSKEKGGWFTPNRDQLYDRIKQVEHIDGNGGSYYYCCNECKQICPLYNKRVSQLIKEDQIKAGLIEDPWYTSVEYQTWRSHIFNLDDNKCVYCEKPVEHAHHILPQKSHPNLALDPDNGISCCKECHYKYGHRDPWCNTGYLSQMICERINRIKKKGDIDG